MVNFLPGFFNAFLGFAYPSHYLRHETAHGFCRLILHLSGGVGVGAEGEACVVMTQHTGDRLDVHAILQGEGGEGMTQVVEADVLQSSIKVPSSA